MQYEDIVYKAGILAMAVRLEGFLKSLILDNVGDVDVTLGQLIEEYANAGSPDPKLLAPMRKINEYRNKCAHPSKEEVGEKEFQEIRGGCTELDKCIAGSFRGDLRRPGDVMISCSLRYDMGNAGDIIKHGILAEFAEWWDGPLRYADPFGGRPWGVAKDEAARRVKAMHGKHRALACAQNADQQLEKVGRIATYYGSSHVVLNASNGQATVFADDADKLARMDLDASGLPIISKDKKLFPGYNPGNGYAILDYAKKAELNLVLLDPYREFMRDEFLVPAGEKRFTAVVDAAKKNPELWIAVFVLDWRETSQDYQKFRNEKLAGRAVGIRCEPLKPGELGGEDSYAMEMLLVSDRLRPERRQKADGIQELLGRIRKLGKSVSFRGSGGKITFIEPGGAQS